MNNLQQSGPDHETLDSFQMLYTSTAAYNERRCWYSHKLKAITLYLQQCEAQIKTVQEKNGSNLLDYLE